MREIGGVSRIALIVPAAGLSTRFPANKLLYDLEGKPVIVKSLSAFPATGMDLFVVVGHQGAEVRAAIEQAGFAHVRFVTNADYRTGMASSINSGLRAAGNGYGYYGFSLGDKPFLRRETVMKLLAVLDRDAPKILAPVYQDQAGHPIFFHSSLYEELLQAEGETGGREVRGQHLDEVRTLAVDDEGAILDMDRYLERHRE